MSIRETLSSFGIESIYHFTDKANLKSIEKYGIQSLSNIESQSINVFAYGAESLSHTLDRRRGLDKFVHLAFVQDHPMYYVAKSRGSIITPVWIELDISILFDDNTLFCDQVANQTGANIFQLDDILDIIDLELITNMQYISGDRWRERKDARKAEIMAYDSININKIKGITYGK